MDIDNLDSELNELSDLILDCESLDSIRNKLNERVSQFCDNYYSLLLKSVQELGLYDEVIKYLSVHSDFAKTLVDSDESNSTYRLNIFNSLLIKRKFLRSTHVDVPVFQIKLYRPVFHDLNAITFSYKPLEEKENIKYNISFSNRIGLENQQIYSGNSISDLAESSTNLLRESMLSGLLDVPLKKLPTVLLDSSLILKNYGKELAKSMNSLDF